MTLCLDFGNVERFEEGWTVDLLASVRLDANAGAPLILQRSQRYKPGVALREV